MRRTPWARKLRERAAVPGRPRPLGQHHVHGGMAGRASRQGQPDPIFSRRREGSGAGDRAGGRPAVREATARENMFTSRFREETGGRTPPCARDTEVEHDLGCFL